MKKLLLTLSMLLLIPLASYATPVDLELSLLVDVSGSVSTAEYDLQKNGYAAAFRDSDVQNAINSGTIGSIAVNYIEWSTTASQRIGWTLLDTVADMNAFADAIDAVTRTNSIGSSTGPGTAINYAMTLFGNSIDNGFEGTRNVIDVSGDGAQNVGDNTAAARNAALAAGVNAVNGIIIEGEAGLEAWYNANVKGGTNAFVNVASSFNDFAPAVEAKLVREITGGQVPEPATMLLFGVGLIGFAGLGRRKE